MDKKTFEAMMKCVTNKSYNVVTNINEGRGINGNVSINFYHRNYKSENSNARYGYFLKVDFVETFAIFDYTIKTIDKTDRNTYLVPYENIVMVVIDNDYVL